ncbi:MAG: UDP-N-acetylmuramoyl-tripeptide--D-alanyl-D-alanine ligase [Acidimicrobiales bacterium]
MRLTTDELAAITGGRAMGPRGVVEGATIDSRTIRPGQLFVPIPAERDGHDFIPAAVAAGAGAYLTAREPADRLRDACAAVVVADTRVALARLGSAARDRVGRRVVGITGSVGKTSTKDFLAAVLARRWPVAASPDSFNNELGVPLTLLGAPADVGAAVVEMGARGPGHIATLAAVARPRVGVVTSVGLAHIQSLGTREAVAEAKSELVRALGPQGTAVLNADDPAVAAMAGISAGPVVTFGLGAGGPHADVTAEDIALDDGLAAFFQLKSPWGSGPVTLGVAGLHQVHNALAAAAAAFVLGLTPQEVSAGLEAARLSRWRMEIARAPGGALVINDAYNANPRSMEAALAALAAAAADRRIALLGPMAELGDLSVEAHSQIGDLARDLGIRVIAVGCVPGESTYPGAESVESADAALVHLGRLGRGDAVLVKASRSAGLEKLAGSLLAAED